MRWQRQQGRCIPVGVNLSAVQFCRQDVVMLVQNALEESGLDPAYLELELTEGTVMMDVERAIKVMKELKRIGVQLAIDDFGTGYSSLAYLKRFPIDTLKVDQSFIRDIASSVSDAEIARTIVQLAHGLGLRVVAEGVETMEQLLFLKEQRCHHIQGFFYSPPVTHDEIAARLRIQPPLHA
jgi:EAL domain-containing protein (putative c-di-GMP-specific phosphodiesterase class I)